MSTARQHTPRLVSDLGHGDYAYCVICQHQIRRTPAGWAAVWSGSKACTGPPARITVTP